MLWHFLDLLLGIQSSALIFECLHVLPFSASCPSRDGEICWMGGGMAAPCLQTLLLLTLCIPSWKCLCCLSPRLLQAQLPSLPVWGKRNGRIKSPISYLFVIHLLLASAAASWFNTMKFVSNSCALLSSPPLQIWKPQENVNPSTLCLPGRIWDFVAPSQEGTFPSLVTESQSGLGWKGH